MAIRVLYFGAAREAVGKASEEVAPSSGMTAGALVEELCLRYPSLGRLAGHLRVAVNHEFVQPTDRVPDRAEVALIPPVAGGAGRFRLTTDPLSLDEVVRAVSGEARGGLVTFSGVVRSETGGRRVVRLEYEAYVPMAEKKLAEIGDEAARKWPGTQVAVLHRMGTLFPGEVAVVIAAASRHRREAFRACEHVIERLKQDAPIWKKEIYEDGAVWVGLGP